MASKAVNQLMVVLSCIAKYGWPRLLCTCIYEKRCMLDFLKIIVLWVPAQYEIKLSPAMLIQSVATTVSIQNVIIITEKILMIGCNTAVFHRNEIEDEVHFIEVCSATSTNKLMAANTIYSPSDSNGPNYTIESEYDPDINFNCENTLCSGICCRYYSENTDNKMWSFLPKNI